MPNFSLRVNPESCPKFEYFHFESTKKCLLIKAHVFVFVLGTDTKLSDVDGLPYWTLLYGNGPGYTMPRAVPTNVSGSEKNAVHTSAVPRQWATHGGEDVPVMAQGPLDMALFSGTMDQTVVAHAIAYAACLPPYSYRCQNSTPAVSKPQVKFISALVFKGFILLVFFSIPVGLPNPFL